MLYYLSAFFQGARVKTLPAIIVPIIMASSFSFYVNSTFDWMIFWCILISAVFLQISVNLANDAMDFKVGVDTSNRKGPARLAQTGKLSVNTVLYYAIFCSLMSAVFGIPMILKAGWPILLFGIIILGLCYCYTGFSFSLINLGLAELVCFLFFGPAVVIVTYYLQTLTFNYSSIYLGIQCGLWALSILLVNYLRDEQEDKQSQRKTVVTVYGRIASLFLLGVIQCFIYLFCFYWMGLSNDGGALAFLIVIPSSILFYFICVTPPSKKYNQFLFFMSLLYMAFASAWFVGLSL